MEECQQCLVINICNMLSVTIARNTIVLINEDLIHARDCTSDLHYFLLCNVGFGSMFFPFSTSEQWCCIFALASLLSYGEFFLAVVIFLSLQFMRGYEGSFLYPLCY